jgi:hypothetical protein
MEHTHIHSVVVSCLMGQTKEMRAEGEVEERKEGTPHLSVAPSNIPCPERL